MAAGVLDALAKRQGAAPAAGVQQGPRRLTHQEMAGPRARNEYAVSQINAAAMEQYRAQNLAEQSRLEAEYKRRRNDLEGRFQLSETGAERKRLASQMAELERQRTSAHATIKETYGAAIKGTRADSDHVLAQGTVTGKENYGAYRQAAEDLTAMMQGVGRGMGQRSPSGAAEVAAEAFLGQGADAQSAAVDQAAGESQALAQVASGLRLARASARAETDELGTGMVNQAQIAHHDRVAERINAERQALAQALEAAESNYSQQRSSLAMSIADAALGNSQNEAQRFDDQKRVQQQRNDNREQRLFDLRMHEYGSGNQPAPIQAVREPKNMVGTVLVPQVVKDKVVKTPVDDAPVGMYAQQTNAAVNAARAKVAEGDVTSALAIINELYGDTTRKAWLDNMGFDYRKYLS